MNIVSAGWSRQVSYQSSSSNVTIASTNNVTYSYNKMINPYFTVYYSNNTSTTIEAYSAGYEIIKVTGYVSTVEEIEKTILDNEGNSKKYYYYTGTNITYNGESIKTNTIIEVYRNYVYPVVTRSRSYSLVGTYYYWRIWYYETNSSDKTVISSNNVTRIEYNDLSSTNTFYVSTARDNLPSNDIDEIYPTDWDDWSTPLTSTWEYDKVVAHSYVSYVAGINSDSVSDLTLKTKIYYDINRGNSDAYIFRYTGNTGSENIYKESTTGTSTTYTKNYAYNLTIVNGALTWNQYATSINNPGGTTMDSILATANSHFGDYQYGVYYGKYYAYMGVNRYTLTGNYYETGYIYRLMPNASNTAFEWVKVKAYVTDTSSNILQMLGKGEASVGDIFYSTATAFSSFFKAGFYKVVLDEKTNIVNLVKFNDLGFATDSETTYTKLTNDKLVARSGDYLGYSGTFTVQISAMIRTYNSTTGTWTEYIKTYKMKFVGSLYEG